MNSLIIIGIVVVLGVLLWVFFRGNLLILLGKAQKKQPRTTYSPAAIKKQVIRIDRDTLLEKSWEFFSKIADVVINKFSRSDQEILLRIGIELENAGVEYCHVINLYEIKQAIAPETAVTKGKDVQKGR